MKVTLDESIRTNPYKIAEMIKKAAIDIKGSKANLNKIKERGWFKRMTSNNTADLADTIIQQNDTIQTFFNIVQAIIFLNMNNTYMLGQIMKNLNNFQGDQQLVNNDLFDMSTQFLQSALVAAENTNTKIDNHEQSLIDITKQLVNKAKLDDEQNERLDNLSIALEDKDKVDKEQSERIKQLKDGIQARKEVDKQQDQLIDRISKELQNKESTDDEQSLQITELYENLKRVNELDKEQRKRIHDISNILTQKEELDKTQTAEIKNIHEILSNSNTMIKALDSSTKKDISGVFEYINKQKRAVKNLSIFLVINTIILIGFIAYELIVK